MQRKNTAERQRRYRENNREKLRVYEAKRYARDREKRIAAQVAYHRRIREAEKGEEAKMQ